MGDASPQDFVSGEMRFYTGMRQTKGDKSYHRIKWCHNLMTVPQFFINGRSEGVESAKIKYIPLQNMR